MTSRSSATAVKLHQRSFAFLTRKLSGFSLLVDRTALAVLLGLIAGLASHAQDPPLVARPILFVHGFCDQATGWSPLQDAVINAVRAQPGIGNLYQDYIQPVYYDGQSVKLWPSGQDFATLAPPSARFFSINFSFGSSAVSDPNLVAQVSILNKADELAQVIRAITTLTHVKDVIVIAHSMGGLDTRAYLEGFGRSAQWPCTDADGYKCLNEGATPYASDIAKLITLDTPHTGVALDNWSAWLPLFPVVSGAIGCFAVESLNREELQEGSYVIGSLLNPGLLNANIAETISNVPITAIQNYTLPGLFADSGDDGAVTMSEQSIAQVPHGDLNYRDVGNNVGTVDDIKKYGCGEILHFLGCLGLVPKLPGLIADELDVPTLTAPVGSISNVTVNATLNGSPWTGGLNYSVAVSPNYGQPFSLSGSTVPYTFYDGLGPVLYNVPPGAYKLSFSGGPSQNSTISPSMTQYLGFNPVTGQNAWNLSFTAAFTSTIASPPLVATLSATSVDGGDGVLQGSVNPKGASTSAWFEWGTDSSLAKPAVTYTQPAGAGTNSVTLSSPISSLEPNTTYYFRIAATGGGGGIVRGQTLQFTTLGTLLEPTLLSPANGATGVSSTPTFSWSSVMGASSGYRILVATSVGALPTDPTVSTCVGVCALNDRPQATSDTPQQGLLLPSTTYYWEVHARSPSQFGTWSSISSFTTGPAGSANDFSIQASPATFSASPGGTATYLVTTNTTSGASEIVTLSASNLPEGISSAVFAPTSVPSGTPSTLTVTLGASVPSGTYTLTIVGVGGDATHSAQVLLTVSAPPSGPAVTLMPPSQTFPDEAVGTPSPSQTVAVRNSGGSALTINAVTIANGSDYVYLFPTGQQFPMILNPGVVFSFQVYFQPTTIGPRPGQILIWDTAPGSPHVLSFTGNGLQAAPSTGTIQVRGNLNGAALPIGYGFTYTLTGPSTYTGSGAATFNVQPGTYALTFNTCCSLTLSSISYSPSPTVAAGGQATFTMNFTAPDDFFGPNFASPPGGSTTQIIPAGTAATFYVDVSYSPNPAVPVMLQVTGLPAGVMASFDKQPSFGSSILTVSTSAVTAPGVYTLSLTGVNSDGLTHPGSNTAALVVTTPPNPVIQRLSVTSSQVQGNGQSWSQSAGGVSADGRYVAFQSFATNLTSSVSNNGIVVRDAQTGTSSLVSLDGSGNPFLSADLPLVSATGRYVVFSASARTGVGVYLRDLQLGNTEREDVASDGSPGNGDFAVPRGISADGRFILLNSDATNLVSGLTSGIAQLYIHDRTTEKTFPVSVASDGTPANKTCDVGAMSADGRYVAFSSAATNLVSLNLGGHEQAFLRDTQTGATTLISLSDSGAVADQGVTEINASPIAINADGRFIAFTSNSTNLAPGANDGSFHIFLRDVVAQQTVLVDVDANGVIPGGPGSSASPSISADGRFLTFITYNQVFIRDMTSNQTVALSLASDGTAGNGVSLIPVISPGGTVVAFGSGATNLVADDTNAVSDAFLAANPMLGTPRVQSITLSSSSALGGESVTGTVVLNAPAPDGGASVTVSVNNDSAQVPAIALVAAGAITGTFSIDTSLVSSETTMTVGASFNGGSAIAILTVEPSPAVAVNPAAWDYGSQSAGSSTAPETFSVENVGTAALVVNSVTLASGQNFHISSNQCSGSVPVGGSCSVSVVFGPTQAGTAFSDSLQINFGNRASIQNVGVSGYSPQGGSGLMTSALQFVPTKPCRVADTRLANGPFGGPELAGATTRNFLIPNSACDIPASAAAYSLNVTVVPDGVLGFLAVWPSGSPQPLVSTLNSDSRVKANAAIVPAGMDGGVAVYVSDASHVILDINGYFVAGDSTALDFYPLTPCRIADTRSPDAPLGGPYLIGGVPRAFPVLSSACNIPATAQAYSLNFTAIPHENLGFLSTWPAGQPQPLVSTLNASTAAVTANAAIVPSGTAGAVNVYASNDSDVIIDVNGYFAPPATGGLSLYNVTPCRALDTRTGNSGPFHGTINSNVSATSCQVPATAQAIVSNATVVPSPNPYGLRYLTLWPTGATQPFVSTLNASDGAVTSNMAIVPASNGSVSAYATDPTQLILDISGYFDVSESLAPSTWQSKDEQGYRAESRLSPHNTRDRLVVVNIKASAEMLRLFLDDAIVPEFLDLRLAR